MVLLTFDTQDKADSFHADFNGKPFSSLEPEILCRRAPPAPRNARPQPHPALHAPSRTQQRTPQAAPSNARPQPHPAMHAPSRSQQCTPPAAPTAPLLHHACRQPCRAVQQLLLLLLLPGLPCTQPVAAAPTLPAPLPCRRRLVYVRDMEVATGDLEAAATMDAPPGHTELPTCPVCLERLDEHISGVVTTVGGGRGLTRRFGACIASVATLGGPLGTAARASLQEAARRGGGGAGEAGR
jgi:hypothetical protein